MMRTAQTGAVLALLAVFGVVTFLVIRALLG
ncbi:hypothetical protein SAMN05192558_1232 [Actinokineospora alba]|uniref:Uncharacterized protein n=1 Tax=Actinokineospora alba TaxID=504798 RepID=A0A1H0WL44_9PSEU|nr:hypothetical protein C8E96_1726 [Actinokineospora alba]SDJ43404.1 hypothetical protein SAMN05421871_115107 [Actinokineospora alba]SDP91271.1 hypothetical protein SAMN05192558_1232 [Actinokineospora alba]